MNDTLIAHIITLIKGMGIGTANVIPGVSGATIAIITGVFERLINAIKSFDMTAARQLCSGRFKEFAKHTDLSFLAPLMMGVLVAILSLAKLLEYLFSDYPVYIWAYFFGLILASVYFVGKTVKQWTPVNCLLCLGGIAFAVALTYANPAVENSHPLYVFLCGIIAICSMILPGISGSFILILMGNYELIVFEGISGFKLGLLLPFLVGCGIGLVGFSHILSAIMKHFKYQTIATLTGFITGSLLIIWPWKDKIFKLNEMGETLMKDGEPVIFKYKPILPDGFSSEVMIAMVFVILGIASIWIMEYVAGSSNKTEE